MLERAVKPKNKRHDTACASTTFRKHNVMTIFVILKSGTEYTRGGTGGGLFFRRIKFFFFFYYCFFSGSKWVKCRVVSCKFPL